MLPRPVSPPCLPMRRHDLVKPPPHLCVGRDVKIMKPTAAVNQHDLIAKSSVAASRQRSSDTHKLANAHSSPLAEMSANAIIRSHVNTQIPGISSDGENTSVVSLQLEVSRHIENDCDQGKIQPKDEVAGNVSVHDREFRRIAGNRAPHADQTDFECSRLDFHGRKRFKAKIAFPVDENTAPDSVHEPGMKA
uniref:Uncharacterized protein n=1 Tax=Cryptomonas curvata TaxID=233186 RepID=A0A7S0QFF7_9CRYP|mmetsp:Transcript_31514/g.65937  ORF Transcript_31514/g.65937 Transcript_31514/m.65937 type:complete len:192 (+) Transcript_31514:34-609(+)